MTAEGARGVEEVFERTLDATLPLALDERRRAELLVEAKVVLGAFGSLDDSAGIREALAMATLLGRRAAELELVSLELSALVDALSVAVRASLSEADARGLRGLMTEGYVEARLERERLRAERALVRATRPFLIGHRAIALVLQGAVDAEWLGRVVETVGPALLHADARAMLVVVHLEGELDDRSAAELATLVDAADVVGARVTFEASLEASRALEARLAGRARVFVDDVAGALERVWIDAGGASERMRARVADLLKRFGVREA